MNAGSSHKVFSVINNIKDVAVKQKHDIDVFKLVHLARYHKCSDYITRACKRIYNDIENSYYDYREMIIYMLHTYLLDNKIDLRMINPKNIKEVMKLYTNEQLDNDKDMIISISKKSNLKGVEGFFKINEDGDSIIRRLVEKRYVSPMIFLYFTVKKPLTNVNVHDILCNEEYKRFTIIVNQINKHL